MSAFGAKRTCPGPRWSLDRSRMTHSGHRPDRNPAAQQSPAASRCAIIAVGSARGADSAAPRFMTCAYRRGDPTKTGSRRSAMGDKHIIIGRVINVTGMIGVSAGIVLLAFGIVLLLFRRGFGFNVGNLFHWF